MLVQDLSGKKHTWKLRGYLNNGRTPSKLHVVARDIIKKMFKTMLILEEVTIPLKIGSVAYLDFYIPLTKTAIEVHGQQHYAYSTLFHSCKMDFVNQQKRDREKEEWLEINGLALIKLPFNRIPEWEEILRGNS